MHPASLHGIQGAGQVRSRQRSDTSREYRGTFAFRREHEADLVQLLAARELVEYVGTIDGRPLRMKVRITDVSIDSGLAYFQGVGDPYGELGAGQAG